MMMRTLWVVGLFASALAGSPANAHGGHGGHEPQPDRAPREVKQAAPTQERSGPPSSVGRGGGGDRSGSSVGPTRRRVTAPHGGTLTATSAGWAEVVLDADGAVSVWFLNRDGALLAPPAAGFATVVGERPQALSLLARGDKLVGQLSSKKGSAVLIVQADVAGRTTTVRVATSQR